jgi:hypothetical protein
MGDVAQVQLPNIYHFCRRLSRNQESNVPFGVGCFEQPLIAAPVSLGVSYFLSECWGSPDVLK